MKGKAAYLLRVVEDDIHELVKTNDHTLEVGVRVLDEPDADARFLGR